VGGFGLGGECWGRVPPRSGGWGGAERPRWAAGPEAAAVVGAYIGKSSGTVLHILNPPAQVIGNLPPLGFGCDAGGGYWGVNLC
jgi:hypothetical protein